MNGHNQYRKGSKMNLELGVGQEINIHSIKSISVQETEKSHTQYYKTLIIRR
mgnify:FL=1